MTAKNGISTENTILLAIHKHCFHCMSGDKELIESCKAVPDSGLSRYMLWEYRQGPLSSANHARKYTLATIHQHCIKCIGSENEINSCSVNGDEGYNKCLLYDYRNGNRRL